MEKCDMYLWRGVDRISLKFVDKPNGVVRKIVNVKDDIFVSTNTYNLYHGRVSEHDDNSPGILLLKRIDFNALDIASNEEYLFVVRDDGCVLKIAPQNLSIVETIVLKEDVKWCAHGCKEENERIRVKSLAASENKLLLVTENGQLWASGDQPEIDVRNTIAKRVIFFEGRTVSDVACGKNFNVAIARKIKKSRRDRERETDTESENDESGEVFVNGCPQCLKNIIPSPMSVTSSDTCPLSMNRHQFGEDHSINTPSPMSITGKSYEIPPRSDGSQSPGSSTSEKDKKENSNTNQVKNVSEENSKDEERRNVILINTEAARQFLTRQLSWVSSYGAREEINGSDPSSEKSPGTIKQNVSTVANLVYEGVKTMGDKVATLSRHMSGSSDINESTREDNAYDLDEMNLEESLKQQQHPSLAHSLRCEEFPWSSSTGSLDHEFSSQQGINERINSLLHAGNHLLSTELWTWGDFHYGQLGTGDTIARAKPVLLAKLNNTGIQKISCGISHTLALTLDGRVYAWGRNNRHQVSPTSKEDQSSPVLFRSNSGTKNERARDMACGAEHSLIMTHHGLFFTGKSSTPGEMLNLDTNAENKDCSPKLVSCSGPYSCCAMTNQPISNISEDLISEQIFLEEMLVVHEHFIKPFEKRAPPSQELNVYETLCRCYTELMSVTALNVLTLWDYLNHLGEAYEVLIIASIEEFIAVYKSYVKAICDVIALSGFTHMGRIVNDLPQVLKRLFSEKIGRPGETTKNSNEPIITMALKHPLERRDRYKKLMMNLITSNGTKMGIERLQEALMKWERMCEEEGKQEREAETTKAFWENSGKLLELVRSPERRLIRESRTHPLSVVNSSRFTTHWFVLLSDVFIHVIGTSNTVHKLSTLWVEPQPDSDSSQNIILITAPEENLTVYTPTPSERNEWLQALQGAIKTNLRRVSGHVPPLIRTSSYSYTKHQFYKDAKYTGRWLNGKPHGLGKLEWNDGRMYIGQFHKGVIQGTGKMEMPSQGIYEGQWKDGQQNGHAIFKYINGDVYEGYFKDGVPHGHGIKKEGHFMASAATVYIGEWANGLKQGYGVMDDIMTGEKYLGSWSNGMKHGPGLIVTLDGIYYEGTFVQNVFMGYGIMIFEDGTHFEGELKSAGIFCGKGTLTFRSGDRLEGNMSGAWNEGVKVNAVLHMNKATGHSEKTEKPKSFGKLCVPPEQKWRAIFRQCYQQLGINEPGTKNCSNNDKVSDSQKVWQNVAVILDKSHQKTLERRQGSPVKTSGDRDKFDESLHKIPNFRHENKLTLSTYAEIENYLLKAFDSPEHPLGALLNEIATVYTATYGGVRVHPLLLSHSVAELRSITSRVYELVSLFFPSLPKAGKECILGVEQEDNYKVVSAASILHPILLPRVHSALFVLYALHHKKEDDAYWERLVKWNKQPDLTLMAFLDIDQKFWGTSRKLSLGKSALTNDGSEPLFTEAIETLQQLKTTFSPLEKLLVVRKTFEKMTQTVQKQLGQDYLWTMDELFPVFNFVVVRAGVLQLGSEIHFIEDFMEPYLENGEFCIMFTTLKACYYQILQEKMSMAD